MKQLLESGWNCDVSESIYYLKFIFKGSEYTRNISFYESLADFLEY